MTTDGDLQTRLWNRNFSLLCANNLFLYLSFDFLTAALPLYMTQSMHLSKSTVGVALSAFSFGGILMRPLAGNAVDAVGRKWIFLASMLSFALLYDSYMLASTLSAMMVVRFLHGMAWGATCIAASTAVVDVIPVRQRGLGLGYHGMASSVASVFAAAAGLAVANAAGYNAMFVFASALCFVALLLGGAVKYPVCAQRPKVWRWSQLLEKTSLPVSLNFLIVSLTTGGLTGFVAIYAREKGFVNIGAFFIISAICGIFSRWIGGIIFNRTGPREVSVAALLMLLFCFPTLVLIPSVMGFYLAAALYGMGSGILYLSFQAMVNNLVPPQRRGAANATLFTILNLGYALGKVLTGFAADAVGLDRTFLCFSAVNAIALAFFVMYVYKHYLTAANAAAAMTNASQ